MSTDPQALERRRSLHGFLKAAGYAVVAEASDLVGGHTVRTYGSHKADGLDAIQIEITLPLRKIPWQREALIEHLAQAIARLLVLWADVHTLAVFRSIDLVTGGVVAGQLRPDADSGDGLFRLGGEPRNRGRLEIRREPGAGARPRRAGVLVLCGEDGNDHYLWVDNEGRHASPPRTLASAAMPERS